MRHFNFDDKKEAAVSMQEVRKHIENTTEIAIATRKDYLAQIDRCVLIFNVNRLEDVMANITDFKSRFSKSDFPHEHFKTVSAYRAWRKKMISILKRVSGISAAGKERRARNDEWTEVLEGCSIIYSGPRGMISINILVDEARKASVLPMDIDDIWLKDLMDELTPSRRGAICRAVGLLEKARQQLPKVAALFPLGELPDPHTVRRAAPIPLPQHFLEQAKDLIDQHCRGAYDKISREYPESRAPATVGGYQAALNKYLSTALTVGVLTPDCQPLGDAFEEPVFNAVVRDWITEQDPARRISDRSMRSYVSNVKALAERYGKPVDYIVDALKINRNLKNGRVQADSMPRETREFCARLVRDRRSELLFRSLHLRFQEQALALIASGNSSEIVNSRIVQFGMISVFSALALWSVPLRINNMRRLRHLGENPTLILPRGARDRAHIIIPGSETKNKEPVRAHLCAGPTRALDVLEWYLAEIRPRVSWADRSTYLFPGQRGEVVSDEALRSWIQNHTRTLGLPMNPHNFRHGLASLYLRNNPGGYSQAASLLCNTPDVVRKFYAWIDEEADIGSAQEHVAQQGRICGGPG